MKLKKWLTGVLAAAMALSLAACSDGGAESADAGSEDSITLGFAQVGSESEWRTANTDNIKAAAEAAGVTLQFSDAQQKQENQIKAIRSFIASDVDVISFCPIVETGWDTVLQEAKDAGIPVVLVDRGVTADPSLYVTHIFADALKEGANAFNWVDEYMTAEGKTPRAGGDQFQVAILEGTVGSSVAADRLQGFTDAMAESPNSGKYNVICSQTGEYTRAKGMEVMESFLKSDGDKIDILFSCNGDMALGAIQATEAAGLKPGEDIVIVSQGGAPKDLNLYQTQFRKPSLTVYCLDYSGSMLGEGRAQVVEAMSQILLQENARANFLQASEQEINILIPFAGYPRSVYWAQGNGAELEALYTRVEEEQAGGGTDIYAAALEGLKQLAEYDLEEYTPAIILLTDGVFSGDAEDFLREYESLGLDVPVFSIMFGDADPTQLEALAQATNARVFDGREDLVGAFRSVKGYN